MNALASVAVVLGVGAWFALNAAAVSAQSPDARDEPPIPLFAPEDMEPLPIPPVGDTDGPPEPLAQDSADDPTPPSAASGPPNVATPQTLGNTVDFAAPVSGDAPVLSPSAPGLPNPNDGSLNFSYYQTLLRLQGDVRALKEESVDADASDVVDRLQTQLGVMEERLRDLESRLRALETVTVAKEGGPSSERPTTGPVADAESSVDTPALPSPPGEETPLESATGQSVPEDTSGVSALPAPPPNDDRDAYEAALRQVQNGRFSEAAQDLRLFMEAHPSSPLVSNARYWLGETHYVRQEYGPAAQIFAENFRLEPKGSKAPDNLLKLGLSLAALDRPSAACVAWESLLAEFPDASSVLVSRAKSESDRIHCRKLLEAAP